MKKLVLLAMIYLIWYDHQHLIAQNNGFVKTYFLEDRNTIFYATRNYQDDVIVVGPIGNDTFNNTGVLLAKIDSNGVIKKLHLFYDPAKMYNLFLFNIAYEGITVSNSEEIIITGTTNGLNDLFEIIISDDLEEHNFHLFESQYPSDRYANNTLVYNSNIYTVGHLQNHNGSYEGFIHKSSMDGSEIWEKLYGSPNDFDFVTSILPNDNNLIVLGGIRGDNNSDPNTSPTITKIFSIDTSGQVISSWQSEVNEEGVTAEGLLRISDRYYYITHPFIVEDIGFVHYYPQIVCRDLDFNLIWRKEYGEPYFENHFNDIAEGPDGYLYAAGYIPVDGITWGRVCKIDPENGELIWEARDTAFVIPGWGSRNRMEGLAVLSSGSVIAVGYTVDTNFREHGLLYKVTADGCIDTLCTTVAIEDLMRNPDERVVVFPNPAHETISFDIPDKEKVNFVELVSLDGILVHHEKLISPKSTLTLDPSKFRPGLYVWVVKTSEGQIVDSGKVMITD